MASTEYEVPLTSIGAKMAMAKSKYGDNPFTTRIIDNISTIPLRMIDERITDHPDNPPEDDGPQI